MDMKPNVFNIYVTWAMNAVLGRMAEADGLLEQYPNEIYAASREMSRAFPPDIKKLYRGVLMEPELVASGLLPHDPLLKFVSFSEDLSVACWFADPQSFVSGFVRKQRPKTEGYIIEHTPKHRGEMLFHYSWANRLVMPGGSVVSLSRLATAHPHFGPEHLHQLEWNLQTQSEVILKPIAEGMPVKFWKMYDCPETKGLDARLLPPMFR